jgi:hypothetical protein
VCALSQLSFDKSDREKKVEVEKKKKNEEK